jgi:hypothetical protein
MCGDEDRELGKSLPSGIGTEADLVSASGRSNLPVKQSLQSFVSDLIHDDRLDGVKNDQFPFAYQAGAFQSIEKMFGAKHVQVESRREPVGARCSGTGNVNESGRIIDVEHWPERELTQYRPSWCKRLGFRLIGIGSFYCRPTPFRRAVGRGLIYAGYFLAGFKVKALVFHR